MRLVVQLRMLMALRVVTALLTDTLPSALTGSACRPYWMTRPMADGRIWQWIVTVARETFLCVHWWTLLMLWLESPPCPC